MPLLSPEYARRNTLRFRSVAHLLRIEYDTRLMNIFSSISCLRTIADVSTDTEVSHVIDIVSRLRIAKKHLTISAPKLNVASLQKKTINFNVVIYHRGTGSATT